MNIGYALGLCLLAIGATIWLCWRAWRAERRALDEETARLAAEKTAEGAHRRHAEHRLAEVAGASVSTHEKLTAVQDELSRYVRAGADVWVNPVLSDRDLALLAADEPVMPPDAVMPQWVSDDTGAWRKEDLDLEVEQARRDGAL